MYRSPSQLHCLTRLGRSYRRGVRRGFTLLEASLATVIVGVAFVAVLQLLAVGTISNLDSAQQTTAVNLARNMRELLLQKTYVSLPTYNGASYSPPRDSRGIDITEMSEWRQQIAVQAVEPDELTTNIVDSTPAAVRITVTVSRNNEKVCDLSWYCLDGTP
jgi:prepilin-type N-terminal cleavage/methylation domain-containing protein